MSLGIDPILSNVFFTLSLLPHLAPAARRTAAGDTRAADPLPFVSVIVALYQEPARDIDVTALSLTQQSYPPDRYEIVFAVEPNDNVVARRVSEWLKEFDRLGVSARTVVTDGMVRLKAHALNRALGETRGKYCAFYDAGDSIDPDQIEKAVRLMEEQKCDVGQARVLRSGHSLLGRLLLLDTCIWHWKYVPVLLGLCGGFPLSGEGLFIKKAVLDETSGFPEVLTEDALLGLMLTARNKRFALVDSTVMEKAPRSALAHFRQKRRWHRGYLTCLRRLIASDMPKRKKFVLALPFCVPVTSGLAFVGWLVIFLRLIGSYAWHQFGMGSSMPEYNSYDSGLYYWSLALACVGIPVVMGSSVHALWCARMIRYAPVALCVPLYWMFGGACAVSSVFHSTTHWVTTER